MDDQKEKLTVKYTLVLTGIETGLGSLLHAYRVPFSGHMLALNQGFFLSRCSQALKGSLKEKASCATQVSLLTALLKSLSPAGKRLTPMLAITVQGFLFAFGYRLFAGRQLGTLVGILLVTFWTLIQPLLIYWLIFGNGLIRTIEYYYKRLQRVVPIEEHHLGIAFVTLIALHILAAVAVTWLSYSKKSDELEERLTNLSKKTKLVFPENKESLTLFQRLKMVGKDMIQPWILGSFLLIGVFYFVTEPDKVKFVWFMLRPIAGSFIVFYALRFLPLDQWFLRLVSNKGRLNFALAKVLASFKR